MCWQGFEFLNNVFTNMSNTDLQGHLKWFSLFERLINKPNYVLISIYVYQLVSVRVKYAIVKGIL